MVSFIWAILGILLWAKPILWADLEKNAGTELTEAAFEKIDLPLTPDQKAWLEAHPVIRYSGDPDWRPLESFDQQGKYHGMVAEMLRWIEFQLSIRFEIVPPKNWTDTLKMAQNREVDMISAMENSERREYLNFTAPHTEFPIVIVTRNSMGKIGQVMDLQGKKIAMPKGYAFVNTFRDLYPRLKGIEVDNISDGLNGLSLNRFDALVISNPVAKHMIHENSMHNLRVNASTPLMMRLGFGVRPDWQPLVEILDLLFAAMPQTIFDDIKQKYLGSGDAFLDTFEDNRKSFQRQQQWKMIALVCVLILLILVSLRLIRLSRSQEKTLDPEQIKRNTFLVLIMFISFVSLAAWIALDNIKEDSKKQSRGALLTVLQSTNEGIKFWINQQLLSLEEEATDPALIAMVKEQLKIKRDPEALRHSKALDVMREFFLHRRKSRKSEGFFVISPDYINIGSMRDHNLGIENTIFAQRSDLLKEVFMGRSKFIPPIFSDIDDHRATMFFAAPIKDEFGHVIAAITQRLNPEDDFSRLCHIGRMGASGETYAFDRNARMLTTSRFEDDLRLMGLLSKGESSMLNIQLKDPGFDRRYSRKSVNLTQRPSTLAHEMSMKGINGVDLNGYRDYRGVDVFGAWFWDEKHRFGMVMEIDKEEAMSSYTTAQNIVLSLLAAITLLSIGLVMLMVNIGRRGHQALLRANDDLEDEVASRTAQLQESEEQSRTIVEMASDGIIMIDQKGFMKVFSPSAEKIFGYKAEEALGNNIKMLMPEPYHSEHDGYLARYLATGAKHIIGMRREVVGLRKDGSTFDMELGVGESVVSGQRMFAGLVRDITDRKKQEQALKTSEERLEAAANSASLGLWDYNPMTGNILINDNWATMLGYHPSELRNGDDKWAPLAKGFDQWLELLHPEDLDENLEKIRAHTEGETDIYRDEVRLKMKNGEYRWVLDVGQAVRNDKGEVVRMTGIHLDIDEIKRLEGALSQARVDAESATQAKSNFLANMSHEIRTPMNAIIGMTHLVLKTELNLKQKNYLSKIDGAAHSLLGIINDILDFSKIEAGKLDIEHVPFTLDGVLDNVSNLMSSKIQDKGLEMLINVGVDVPRSLIGDPLRIGQILINLMGNAVKFTEKGDVMIGVELLQRTESKSEKSAELKFYVKDTGIGLTQQQAGKLFQAFTQADASTTRKHGGTGLGLSISKNLAELMGGRIWVESEHGVGSTFFFSIKVKLGEDPGQKTFMPAPNLKNMKVLVVDDNATSREILQDMLESFTFRVIQVSSGKEAITEVVQSEITGDPYRLVIMDWKMPEIDGIEATKRIRAHQDILEQPRMIMLTAYGREEVMEEARLAGLDGFLIKPTNPSVVFDTINQTFSSGEFMETISEIEETVGPQLIDQIRGAKLLLVEDNVINQEVALGLLEDAQLNIDVANNGREALDFLRGDNPYDAVLMDLQMPVMDGYSATREIRKDSKFDDLPVIAMTANAMKIDVDMCRDAGMNGHIPKPIDPMVLYDTLAQHITSSKRQGTLESQNLSTEAKPLESKAEASDANSKLRETTPPEKTEAAFPELDGIDIDEGLVRMGGKPELYKKVLLRFATEESDALKRLQDHLDNESLEDAQRIAHTLKGLSGNIGAKALHELFVAMDASLKDGDTKSLTTIWEPLEHEMEKILNSISQLEASSNQTVESNDQDMDSQLDDIEALLEEDDSDAVDLLDAFCEQSLPLGLQDIKKVRDLVAGYDFDEALELLKELRVSWKGEE